LVSSAGRRGIICCVRVLAGVIGFLFYRIKE